MMKYLAATAALVSVLPSITAGVTIDTPFNVVQCQPQMLNFRGSPPFYLSIIPGGQPSAAPLRTFPKQTETSITVITDLPAGTTITYAVKDVTGETGFTDMVTVQKSLDNSCLGSAPPSQTPSDKDNGNTMKPPQGPTPSTPATKPGSVAGGPPAAAGAGAGPASPMQPTLTVATTRPIGGIQAVSSTVSSPLATATLPTSGAESRFTINNFGLAAIWGLFGAFLLMN